MPKRKKKTTMKDTFKWKRKSTGHYTLWGEYVVEEMEIIKRLWKENKDLKNRLDILEEILSNWLPIIEKDSK